MLFQECDQLVVQYLLAGRLGGLVKIDEPFLVDVQLLRFLLRDSLNVGVGDLDVLLGKNLLTDQRPLCLPDCRRPRCIAVFLLIEAARKLLALLLILQLFDVRVREGLYEGFGDRKLVAPDDLVGDVVDQALFGPVVPVTVQGLP